jgi:hypothetical protein
MAKPLNPPAPVAVYALAYVFLSLQLPLDLTGDFRISLSGLLFAPLLAAWMGARFGRRGLLPLWLSAPLTVPDWYLEIDYAFALELGLGAALFAVCVLLTLVFAAKRDAGGQQVAASPVWIVVSVVLLVAAAGYAEAGLSLASSRVSFGINAPWSFAAATFALVALRRCPPSLAAAGIVAVAVAGYAADRFSDLYWSTDGGTYAYAFDAAAGWGMRAVEAGSFGLAAVLAGLIVRDWQGLGAAETAAPRALAGLALLLILPPLLTVAEVSLERATEEQAVAEAGMIHAAALPAMAAAPVLLQAVEEVIVTASRRRPPSAEVALGHPAAGHLLALFSLVLGAALGRRAAFWLPQAVTGAALVTALALERAIYGPGYFADYYFAEDFFRENFSALLWAAFACWTFVWMGMRARLKTHELEAGVK